MRAESFEMTLSKPKGPATVDFGNPLDWPNSTSAAASTVAGIDGLTVSTAVTHFWLLASEGNLKTNAIGEDMFFLLQIGGDIDHAVGE